MPKMNIDAINDLVNHKLGTAQVNAVLILNTATFKNGAKKVMLIRDIEKAKTSAEVCRIMYYTYLAGEGLSTVNAPWQQRFG